MIGSLSSLIGSFAGFVFLDPVDEKCARLRDVFKMPWLEPGKDLAHSHPEAYVRDILRFSIHVGAASFFCEGRVEGDERAILQGIDNEMLGLINALPGCLLSTTTQGVQLIRYRVQELLTADLFVVDKEFQATYTRETYLPKYQLLFPLKNDTHSCFSLTRSESTLIIRAVQYWQVANQGDPTIIYGYDALHVTLEIDLNNVAQDNLQDRFESARCHLRFHGFCDSLQKVLISKK